jgi:hypothetical protein
MTIAGDIALSLKNAASISRVTFITPWQDAQGRQRMRVEFAR